MFRADEALADQVVEKHEQGIVISGYVEHAQGLGVLAQLRPGPDFEKFLQRAQSAGQRDKGVRQLRHQRLSLMHGAHYAQVAELAMRHLALHQAARHDANDLAARASTASATAPIRPTPAPPYTNPMFLAASCLPSSVAASRYSGLAPSLDPQKTQMRRIISRVLFLARSEFSLSNHRAKRRT